MEYSEKVLDHFFNPRNVGVIEDADGIGEVGNPICGDMMTFYIKVEGDRLTDVKYKTFGCGAAIAVASMVSEMAKGKTIEEALKITRDMIADELGGLPDRKLHCSNLGADALHAAIRNFMDKRSGVAKPKMPKTAELGAQPKPPGRLKCPYCESVLAKDSPICEACKRQIRLCTNCGFPLRAEERACPNCLTRL